MTRPPMILLLAAVLVLQASAAEPQARLEEIHGQTILLFTPHPDDDTFCCAGALALLAKNGNNVRLRCDYIFPSGVCGSGTRQPSPVRLGTAADWALARQGLAVSQAS